MNIHLANQTTVVHSIATLTGLELDARIRKHKGNPARLALLVADLVGGKIRVGSLTPRQARALVPGVSYGYTASHLSPGERLNIDRNWQTLADAHLKRQHPKPTEQQIEKIFALAPDTALRVLDRLTSAQQAAE